MKTAIIVAGVCRYSELTYKSWNSFPEADWYLSTWDISQTPYSPEATSSDNEIATIKHLFHSILISNYQTEYLDLGVNSLHRPFILLENVLNKIKDQGYERIIYFRPDLMLYRLSSYSPNDFVVDDDTVKILDCHYPGFWFSHYLKKMQDSFLVFSYKNFELFVNSKDKLCKQPNIHTALYKFMIEHKIKVVPLYNMRSAIVRKLVDNVSWQNLTKIFIETYFKKNHIGKFTNRIELTLKQEPDYEKIKISQASGGILKLRNK